MACGCELEENGWTLKSIKWQHEDARREDLGEEEGGGDLILGHHADHREQGEQLGEGEAVCRP